MAEQVTAKPLPLNELDGDKYGAASQYDIVNEYDWTLAGQDARTEVSELLLTQYELDANALLANLKYWTTPILSEQSNPYEGLYRAKPTGVSFILPWFEEYHHQVTQNWEDFKGLESSEFADKIVKGVQLLTNSPGIAINTPKIWKGAALADVPYTITLFNTTGKQDSIEKNKKFINRLISSTLHDQQNPLLATPPALYSMEIKGVRYSPACVLANLTISNVGTMIKAPNGEVLPEAYKVAFQVRELISESRQIFEGAIGGSKVEAIVSSDGAVAQNQDSDLQRSIEALGGNTNDS